MEQIEKAAQFITERITRQLESGKNVLFFATGGSSITVVVRMSEILRTLPHRSLTVTLTDERYDAINHPDSNWQQLSDKGFVLPEARLIPILTGDDFLVTTQKFNTILGQEFTKDSYKIGLFGIGADGHTAGILPGSGAVDSPDLAYGYKTEKFDRITITPKAIMKLDEAIVFTKGEDKWPTLAKLEEEVNLSEQPAQILKKVPLLTMFTDYPDSRA
ncbi:MAG: 6-phosphogluconolactonase [Candidatus Paceibacterota bacterium]|jgi:6-phosphogluconolactonase/glucosamine-6-phosphate isomerase/deaminase